MSDPIVVLAMHRSGTSFLVRALNLAGLWIGGVDELSTVEGRAMIGNPKGNYENRGSISINDMILARSGGTWIRPPERVIDEGEDRQRIREFCADLQRSRPADFVRWGWKDPRTVLTLDVWLQAMRRNAFIVASFRHPSAVARSLLVRDRLPLEWGYGLWAYYNAHLIRHLKRFAHVLVRFDVGRDELLDQVWRVCESTGLTANAATIASWYDAGLVRSRCDPTDEPLTQQVEPLWKQLLELHRAQ